MTSAAAITDTMTIEDVLVDIARKVVLVSPIDRLDVFRAELANIAPAIIAQKQFVVERVGAIRSEHPDRDEYLEAIRADIVLGKVHSQFLNAVDRLQAIAGESGLISTFGQDAIQQVLADGLCGDGGGQ